MNWISEIAEWFKVFDSKEVHSWHIPCNLLSQDRRPQHVSTFYYIVDVTFFSVNERKWGFSVQKKEAIVWYKSSNEKRCSLFISSIFFILLHSGDLRGIAHKTQKIWLLGAMLKRNLIAWNFLYFLLLASCHITKKFHGSSFYCYYHHVSWFLLSAAFGGMLEKYLNSENIFCVTYRNTKIEWVQLKYPCLVKTSQRNE